MSSKFNQEVTTSALEALRTYMYHFYPDRQTKDPFPLEFWTLDDDLFYDFMNYLPAVFAVQFRGISEHVLRHLPEALQILWPIFSLEDGYDCDGWTALSNAGEHELPLIIAAYQRIGMSGEAAALTAVLRVCRNGVEEDDSDIFEEAYKSVKREYDNDEERRMAVISYIRHHPDLWE